MPTIRSPRSSLARGDRTVGQSGIHLCGVNPPAVTRLCNFPSAGKRPHPSRCPAASGACACAGRGDQPQSTNDGSAQAARLRRKKNIQPGSAFAHGANSFHVRAILAAARYALGASEFRPHGYRRFPGTSATKLPKGKSAPSARSPAPLRRLCPAVNKPRIKSDWGFFLSAARYLADAGARCPISISISAKQLRASDRRRFSPSYNF